MTSLRSAVQEHLEARDRTVGWARQAAQAKAEALIRRRSVLAQGILYAAVLLGTGDSPADSPPAASTVPPSKVPYRGMPETISSGQPASLTVQWGPAVGYHYRYDEDWSARLNLGFSSEVVLPQIGFLDFTFEGAVGTVGSDIDGALSAYLKFPYANPGIEYNLRDTAAYFKLTAIGAPRRGGLLGIGDRLRLDWVPASGLLQVGIAVEQPLGTYRRSRPMNRHVYMAKAGFPEERDVPERLRADEALQRLRESMTWMDLLFLPRFPDYDPGSEKSERRFDEAAASLASRIAQNGGFLAEDSLYHRSLEDALTAALSGDRENGAALARKAEGILLEDVVIPVNQLFGRLKKPVDLSAPAKVAAVDFAAALADFGRTVEEDDAAAEVFRAVLLECQVVAERQKKRWDDSRLVWLPLEYGLRRSEIASQEALDGIYERVLGLPFTSCNDIGYLFNDGFFYFYKDLLLDTEHYQVTIIHDFRSETLGRDDEAAWDIVAGGYVEAFIRAIEAMDRGEREILPEFFLFLDEHYYRANRSGPIVSFLERLFEQKTAHLDDPNLEALVQGQLDRLQAAVVASPALRRFGEEYVRRNLKVHVNITNPFDPTFKEDALARDHRKVAFRDVFEEDPGAGAAGFTGEGIGVHYVGPTWEDRTLLVRGPELRNLKTETRNLFLSQGFEIEDVPYFLRERPVAEDDGDKCEALRAKGWTTKTVASMNHTGFMEKRASVSRMALYNVLPSGSLLLIPDSIWASDFWASVLVAAALRGVQVYAVSPSQECAPSDAGPTLSLVRESLAIMARGSETLGREMERAGGALHVGVFDANYDVCSALTRVETLLEPLDECLVQGNLDFCADVRSVLLAEKESLAASGEEDFHHVTAYGSERVTKLHQKTQFAATREGIRILQRPEWAPFLTRYLEHHRDRCRRPESALDGIRSAWLVDRTKEGKALVEAFEEEIEATDPGAKDRVAFYLTVGSSNQDRRSMLMDGETTVTISGYESLVSILDFLFVLHSATWLESSDAVDRYFKPEGGLIRSVSRWIRNLI